MLEGIIGGVVLIAIIGIIVAIIGIIVVVIRSERSTRNDVGPSEPPRDDDIIQ